MTRPDAPQAHDAARAARRTALWLALAAAAVLVGFVAFTALVR